MKLSRGKISKIRKAKKQSVIKGGKVKRRGTKNKTFRRKGGSNIRYKSIRRKSPKRRYRGGNDACPAKEIDPNTMSCDRKGNREIFGIHPDKNPGCLDEAAAKTAAWNERCSEDRAEADSKKDPLTPSNEPNQQSPRSEFPVPDPQQEVPGSQFGQRQQSASDLVPFEETIIPTQQQPLQQQPLQQQPLQQQPLQQEPLQQQPLQQEPLQQQSAMVTAPQPVQQPSAMAQQPLQQQSAMVTAPQPVQQPSTMVAAQPPSPVSPPAVSSQPRQLHGNSMSSGIMDAAANHGTVPYVPPAPLEPYPFPTTPEEQMQINQNANNAQNAQAEQSAQINHVEQSTCPSAPSLVLTFNTKTGGLNSVTGSLPTNTAGQEATALVQAASNKDEQQANQNKRGGYRNKTLKKKKYKKRKSYKK